MSINRVLITGATGFLGSAVVHQAISAGFSVTATDRSERIKISGADFISADILDPMSLSKVLGGVDCVCHVAGLAHVFNKSEVLSAPFHAVNVVGAKNVAHAAINSGVQQFIFISSVSVYGGESHGKDEDSDCHPKGLYPESKFQAEQYLIKCCQSAGINLTILRLATLYGEEDPGNVGHLIRSIEQGRFIWVGEGENQKSLLHRDDAARACIAVIKSPVPGINIFNVSAPPRKMLDIVTAIASSLGKPIPLWHIPAFIALKAAKLVKHISFDHVSFNTIYYMIEKWLAHDYYNTEKFCKTFNFKAEISLEEGIRREVDWYRNSLLPLN